MSTAAPSGEQVVLESGAHRAVIVEVGGGVRTYTAFGVELLDGYAEDERCPAGAGQLLAPWPNRLGDGRYRFGGEALELPITEPETGTAIHGLVRWARWSVVGRSGDGVALRCAIGPEPGYPFSVELTVRWSLGPDGLRAEQEARNTGEGACPFGFGAHPYLTVPGVAVDEMVLTLPASRWLATDARMLPVAERSVEDDGGVFDFRAPRRIGATRIDTAFTGVVRGVEDGLARARLTDARGAGAELWMDGAFSVLQVFTSDSLPGARQRRSVAIEPMTCEPNALRSGRGLVVLGPGEVWRGAWGIRPVQPHGTRLYGASSSG